MAKSTQYVGIDLHQDSVTLAVLPEGALNLNQGTIYPALLRLEQKGWIDSDWGMSENNRRARFYTITAAGKRRLAEERNEFERLVLAIQQVLAT